MCESVVSSLPRTVAVRGWSHRKHRLIAFCTWVPGGEPQPVGPFYPLCAGTAVHVLFFVLVLLPSGRSFEHVL